MDVNKDGVLSREEIFEGYEKNFGHLITMKEVDLMFDSISNGLQEIPYSQFVVAALDRNKKLTLNQLRSAFDAFDIDNSGALSPDEIKDIVCFDA